MGGTGQCMRSNLRHTQHLALQLRMHKSRPTPDVLLLLPGTSESSSSLKYTPV